MDKIQEHKAKIEAYKLVLDHINQAKWDSLDARLIKAFIQGCIKGQNKLIEIESIVNEVFKETL